MNATADEDELGARFWACTAIGSAVLLVGVRGLWHDHLLSLHADWWRWFVGAGLVHDVAIAPLFVLVGALSRALAPRMRNAVRAGLGISTLLIVVLWPLVQGWGRRDAVPSALPLDYGRNLVVTLAVLWVVVLLAVVRAYRRSPS